MRTLALGVAVAVVLLIAVLDRSGAAYAERRVAEDVESTGGLESPPDVRVTGLPFLTQALSGTYDRVVIQARDVPAGGLLVSRLEAELVRARLPLSAALFGDVTEVPISSVTAQALVTYDEISRRYEDRDLVVEPEGDRLRVSGTLGAFGQTVAVEALSRVEVVDGQFRVTAEQIRFGDEGEQRALPQELRVQVDLRVPVDDLPYGLTVTAVDVRPDGVVLSAQAQDVLLRQE